MAYTYYTKVESYEHMLSCTELAVAYAIFTTKETPKPHSRLVAVLLNEYYKEHPEEEKLYYPTKYGLMQVWPADIYKPILESIISNNPLNTEMIYVTEKGKNYSYQIAPALIRIP
jgi:hypothetical protein